MGLKLDAQQAKDGTIFCVNCGASHDEPAWPLGYFDCWRCKTRHEVNWVEIWQGYGTVPGSKAL